MPEYRTPGVYVEEVPGSARPIEAVGTSTAAFFGVAPGHNPPLRKATFISSYQSFADSFTEGAKTTTPLVNAVGGFFQNGGSRAYVVHLGPDASQDGPQRP